MARQFPGEFEPLAHLFLNAMGKFSDLRHLAQLGVAQRRGIAHRHFVVEFPGEFEPLDHILCTGRPCLPDDVVHLRFHSKSPRSRANVGRLLVPDHYNMAALVRSHPVVGPTSFRIPLDILTSCIAPSGGSAGEKRLGFLPCQTYDGSVGGLYLCMACLAFAFVFQVDAA